MPLMFSDTYIYMVLDYFCYFRKTSDCSFNGESTVLVSKHNNLQQNIQLIVEITLFSALINDLHIIFRIKTSL